MVTKMGRACEFQGGVWAADKLTGSWPDLPGSEHTPWAVKSLTCELFGARGREIVGRGGRRAECGLGQV